MRRIEQRGRPAPDWFENIPRLRNRYYSTKELEILLGANARTIAARFKSRGVRSRTGKGPDRNKSYWSGMDIKDIGTPDYVQPSLF